MRLDSNKHELSDNGYSLDWNMKSQSKSLAGENAIPPTNIVISPDSPIPSAALLRIYCISVELMVYTKCFDSILDVSAVVFRLYLDLTYS